MAPAGCDVFRWVCETAGSNFWVGPGEGGGRLCGAHFSLNRLVLLLGGSAHENPPPSQLGSAHRNHIIYSIVPCEKDAAIRRGLCHHDHNA